MCQNSEELLKTVMILFFTISFVHCCNITSSPPQTFTKLAVQPMALYDSVVVSGSGCVERVEESRRGLIPRLGLYYHRGSTYEVAK